MGGKGKDSIIDFIESLKDDKLIGIRDSNGTVYEDVNMRLDMQCLTTQRPQLYNLQVQINKGCKISSLKKLAPKSVAMMLVPIDESMTPSQIRQGLLDSMKATSKAKDAAGKKGSKR